MVLAGAGCRRTSADFFPLSKDYTWTYQIRSKSERASYLVIDRVVGQQYIPALKLQGEVVSEFYSLPDGGLKPLVYFETPDGYLSRLSGLDYKGSEVIPPQWGAAVEDRFLPIHLQAGLKWDNAIIPFGKLWNRLHILQHHHTFTESKSIRVPAGEFAGCIRIETAVRYKVSPDQGRNLPLYYIDWYAPNIGLIESIALQGSANGPETEHVELIKYDVTGVGRK